MIEELERAQRAAVVLNLLEKLDAQGSWCGETHVQKATYFLQELLRVPLNYTFILYRFGPYSFDFSNELASFQADRLLDVRSQPYPYGPRLKLGEASEQVVQRYGVTRRRFDPFTGQVANWLGEMGVAELERVATALYVTRQEKQSLDEATRAARICAFKPHINFEVALTAIKMVDGFIAEARPFSDS